MKRLISRAIDSSWTPIVIIVVIVTAVVLPVVLTYPGRNQARYQEAKESVRAACGVPASERFSAFIDAADIDGKDAKEEASSWAERCATK